MLLQKYLVLSRSSHSSLAVLGVFALLPLVSQYPQSRCGLLELETGHPFDLTKTRLQTAPPGVYKGALDVVRKTVAQDGLTG